MTFSATVKAELCNAPVDKYRIELAELCGVSTVYFRKLFDSVYGVPPIRWLNTLRMERACAMLESDYESIGQIAESVGCTSIYHFSRSFRAHTGVSPSEYAKREKNKQHGR